jgi:hypothetical protein
VSTAAAGTTHFEAATAGGYAAGTITVVGDDVLWDVPDNNDAVRTARATPLAIHFFEALRTTVWTPGTGGRGLGNDEHHQLSARGAFDHPTFEFGPK